MSSQYRTIAAPAQAQFREKMSRFIAFAFPVTTPEQAREAIAAVARDYHDARHVCWAYLLGADSATAMSNDNGEPSGTAGKPILGQIRSAQLTNVAIAVVRYFGGIKLGTSGLIAAYREAARLVLETAEKITAFELAHVAFTFPYTAMNDVMRIVKEGEDRLSVVNRQFNNSCSMTLAVRCDAAEALARRLADIDGACVSSITNIL